MIGYGMEIEEVSGAGSVVRTSSLPASGNSQHPLVRVVPVGGTNETKPLGSSGLLQDSRHVIDHEEHAHSSSPPGKQLQPACSLDGDMVLVGPFSFSKERLQRMASSLQPDVETRSGATPEHPHQCNRSTAARQALAKVGKRATSKFKGVNKHARSCRWEAHIWDKRQLHLGCFDNELQAAAAHDIVALKSRGHTAILNFPLHHYQEELPLLQQVPLEQLVQSIRASRRIQASRAGCETNPPSNPPSKPRQKRRKLPPPDNPSSPTAPPAQLSKQRRLSNTSPTNPTPIANPDTPPSPPTDPPHHPNTPHPLLSLTPSPAIHTDPSNPPPFSFPSPPCRSNPPAPSPSPPQHPALHHLPSSNSIAPFAPPSPSQPPPTWDPALQHPNHHPKATPLFQNHPTQIICTSPTQAPRPFDWHTLDQQLQPLPHTPLDPDSPSNAPSPFFAPHKSAAARAISFFEALPPSHLMDPLESSVNSPRPPSPTYTHPSHSYPQPSDSPHHPTHLPPSSRLPYSTNVTPYPPTSNAISHSSIPLFSTTESTTQTPAPQPSTSHPPSAPPAHGPQPTLPALPRIRTHPNPPRTLPRAPSRTPPNDPHPDLHSIADELLPSILTQFTAPSLLSTNHPASNGHPSTTSPRQPPNPPTTVHKRSAPPQQYHSSPETPPCACAECQSAHPPPAPPQPHPAPNTSGLQQYPRPPSQPNPIAARWCRSFLQTAAALPETTSHTAYGAHQRQPQEPASSFTPSTTSSHAPHCLCSTRHTDVPPRPAAHPEPQPAAASVATDSSHLPHAAAPAASGGLPHAVAAPPASSALPHVAVSAASGSGLPYAPPMASCGLPYASPAASGSGLPYAPPMASGGLPGRSAPQVAWRDRPLADGPTDQYEALGALTEAYWDGGKGLPEGKSPGEALACLFEGEEGRALGALLSSAARIVAAKRQVKQMLVTKLQLLRQRQQEGAGQPVMAQGGRPVASPRATAWQQEWRQELQEVLGQGERPVGSPTAAAWQQESRQGLKQGVRPVGSPRGSAWRQDPNRWDMRQQHTGSQEYRHEYRQEYQQQYQTSAARGRQPEYPMTGAGNDTERLSELLLQQLDSTWQGAPH